MPTIMEGKSKATVFALQRSPLPQRRHTAARTSYNNLLARDGTALHRYSVKIVISIYGR